MDLERNKSVSGAAGPIKRVQAAAQMMEDYSEERKIHAKPYAGRRYLWTDAFALCTFIELYRLTEDRKYAVAARVLVDAVHTVLGRFGENDSRSGWISGLDEEAGKLHPTIGGLRIGKPLAERLPDEEYDPRLEWERDGQYYHYLCKWMHALTAAGAFFGIPAFISWAAELAKTAHERFTYTNAKGEQLMYWKMSIDLSRPLVPSMGQHDPLDGLSVYYEIEGEKHSAARDVPVPSLEKEIREMDTMCRYIGLETSDPLGAGGLLFDLFQLLRGTAAGFIDRRDLITELLEAALNSVGAVASAERSAPAELRLAFRELGLSIGLQTVPYMLELVEDDTYLRHNMIIQRQ